VDSLAAVGAELFLIWQEAKGQALGSNQIPVSGESWRRYEIILNLPAATRSIILGLRLTGNGAAWLDDVRLRDLSEPESTHAIFADGFERGEAGLPPPEWYVPSSSREAGFRVETTSEMPYAGKQCVRVARRLDVDIPDPGQPLIDDLGEGLAALVPLALYTDTSGTLPHAVASTPPLVGGKPPGFKPSGADRSTRLAAVILLSAAIEGFYPHFADIAATWPDFVSRALREAALDPDERSFVDTLRRLVAGLRDGHAEVIHESDNADFRIPAFWEWIGNQLVVSWVAPAAAAVLRPGDVVLKVDGRPAGAALEALLPLAPGATPGFRRVWALEQLASGDENATHELVVQQDGKDKLVRLSCNEHRFGPHRLLEAHHEKVQELAPGVFYLDLGRIDDADFKAAFPHLVQARAIVFDLRGYPEAISPDLILGHLLDRAAGIGDAVVIRSRPRLGGGRLGQKPDNLDTVVWQIEPTAPRIAAKVAFLTDARAVSRAEVVLSFVRDYHLAAIVGSPTAGTRGEVNEMDLPGDYQVFWTGTLSLNADGTAYDAKDGTTTVAARPTGAGLAAGRDEVLDAALAALLGN
jgi:hypothetical protein